MEKDYIEFFVPMIPPTITAQQRRITKTGKIYDSMELKEAKESLKAHIAAYKPAKPMDGALRLVVKWCFPVKGKHKNGEYKATKPDTDNLNKALKDIMEKLGFYVNDSRVACEIIEKFYADIPGIYIRLERIHGK